MLYGDNLYNDVPMERVIVDSSSILFALSNKVDLFEKIAGRFPDLRACVPSGVVRELGEIANGRRRESTHARIGLEIIGKSGIEIIRSSGYVDDWIVKNSRKTDIVCTNDTELRRRLKARGIIATSISRGGRLA